MRQESWYSRRGRIRNSLQNGGARGDLPVPRLQKSATCAQHSLIRIDMRAPNGTIYPMSGVYLEIIKPERITYTAGALNEKGAQLFEFLHVVTFGEKQGKTTLVMKTRLVKATSGAAKYIGGFEAGMSQSLEKLADQLMTNSL